MSAVRRWKTLAECTTRKFAASSVVALEQEYEAGRNTVVTPLSAVPSPANGGPAAWNQLGVSRVGTGDKVLSLTDEASRNTNPGEANVIRQADGGPASYKIQNVTKTPTFNLSAAEAIASAAGYAAAQALYTTWEAARNVLLATNKVLKDFVYTQFGVDRVGSLESGGGAQPSAPGLVKKSEGVGKVTLTISGLLTDDVAYLVCRRMLDGEAWSAQSESFKATANGDFDYTGLTGGTSYEFAAYIKRNGTYGKWCTPVMGTPTSTNPATYTLYRVVRVERVPGEGRKRLFLQKVGAPVEGKAV